MIYSNVPDLGGSRHIAAFARRSAESGSSLSAIRRRTQDIHCCISRSKHLHLILMSCEKRICCLIDPDLFPLDAVLFPTDATNLADLLFSEEN